MELTKQELIDYLRIVGSFHWNIMELTNEIENIDFEKQQLYVKQRYEKQQYIPLSFCIKQFVGSLLISVVIGIIVQSILMTIVGALYSPPEDTILSYILFSAITLIAIAVVAFLLLRSKGWALLYNHIKGKKNDMINSINFATEEKQRLKDAPARDAELENKRNQLMNMLDKSKNDLDQAYEMNILYHKYRNFDAVFSMYEYFQSGSVDTLKEAINKYDTESRMDTMISKLGEINETTHRIYDEMQYQTQLSEKNLELTQQQLEYSRITANNTYQIAKNTRITALNTSLLLLLQEREAFYRGY